MDYLRNALRSDVLLVLDAAYCEYVDDPDYTSGHDLVEPYDNIVVTRTFSKIYAMGGMRLGWAHATLDIIDVLNRVRGPFNVSSAAQIAGLAALNDDAFLKQSIELNKRVREWTIAEIEALGFSVEPSACNFVLADFASSQKADDIREYLKSRGVIVRQMDGYGLPTCLRITIGTEEEMKLAIQFLKEYLM